MSLYDLGLDPKSLILKFDREMVKMWHHTKIKFLSNTSKVIAQIDTQTLVVNPRGSGGPGPSLTPKVEAPDHILRPKLHLFSLK